MPKGSPKGFDGHPNVVDVEIPQRIVAQRVVDALRPYERDYTEVAQEIGDLIHEAMRAREGTWTS